MFERQQTGSVLCPSCSQLVGVRDDRCFHCGRRNPGLWGFTALFRALGRDMGFVPLVTWVCGALYLASLLADPSGISNHGLLSFLSPSGRGMLVLGASGAGPLFTLGAWWTPLSAGWLHGGLLHIVFNMMWVRNLAPTTVHLYGPGRTMIIYTVASLVGFLASSVAGLFPLPWPFRGAGLTIGASAAVFGLLGALYHFGQRGGSSHIGQQAKTYALLLGVFGFIIEGIDNWAHLGGFVGGYFISRWLDPLQPERLDHLLWGMACLAASALAVLCSVYRFHSILS
jgi:rhomboid protease GluP